LYTDVIHQRKYTIGSCYIQSIDIIELFG
jgi:hypothetical protein